MRLNSVIIWGRLGRDPEVRSTSGGKQVATLAVAMDSGGKNPKTTWVNVKAWDRLAEFAAQYLSKGSAVLVRGRLDEERWEDKEGNKRSMLTVVADQLDFGAPKSDSAQRETKADRVLQPSPHGMEPTQTLSSSGDDDLPF